MTSARLTPQQKQRYEQLFEIAAGQQECEADDIDDARADEEAWQGLIEEWPGLAAYTGADD